MNILNPKKNLSPCDKPVINVAEKDSLVSQLSRQTEWSFRIYAQMTHRQENGYNNYFFTLTYKDKFLPQFTYKGVTCPCFNREHITRFTRGIQMDLLKKYNVTDYDYILCCEFGKSATFRPHLHASISVPNSVNAQQVHDLIKKHWSVLTGQYTKTGLPLRESLGWVLPDKYYGGMDKKGHYHKPLLISPQNLDNAAIYVSKYCTKQLGFFSNGKVKKVSRLIAESNDMNAKRSFRRVCPFIHTSLHYGEIISEWVFGRNLPKNGLITASANPFENLADGLWTPLCRKAKTRIPYYITRKLMYDRIEEVVERVVSYEDQDWYTYSIFDTDIFEGLRPLVKERNLRYRWITQYSQFWIDYNKWLMPRRIEQRKNDIDYFLAMRNEKHFVEFMASVGVSKQHLDEIFAECDSRDLALYDVVYRNRFSPAHYYALWKNPTLFYNNMIAVEKTFRNPKYSRRYLEAIGIDIVTLNEYVGEEFFDTYHNFCTTYMDVDFEMDILLNDENIFSPYFTGHESIEEMSEKSLEFYINSFYYMQTLDDTRLSPQFNCLFNSFPCFRGFDNMLNLVADYKQFCSENKIRKIQADFEDKKSKKDALFNN